MSKIMNKKSSEERMNIIRKHRIQQPLEELARKAKKAKRKRVWTEEEIIYSHAYGSALAQLFRQSGDTPW